MKEFLGYLLLLILVHITVPRLGLRRVIWTGDNTSALSLAATHKVKSSTGQFANLVDAWLLVYADLWVSETPHTPGVAMGVIDDLSRDRPTPSLWAARHVNIASEVPEIVEIFAICDPFLDRSLEDHHAAFCRVHSLLSRLSVV